MALYKNVLHHSANKTPKWFLETVGVYVSMLNACDYCVDHHFEGLRRLLNDDDKANALKSTLAQAVETGAIEAAVLERKEVVALAYARRLTANPASITAADVANMRNAGWEDGEILEINQVAAYFAYANRTVLGLGVTTKGDVLGLSPNSGDGEDWSHQ